MLRTRLQLSTAAIVIISLLLVQQPTVNGLRILGLFIHPGLSHFHFFHPVLRGLAEAGHEVTVVSELPDPNPPKGYTDLVLKKSDGLVNAVDLDVIFNYFFYKINQFLTLFAFKKKTG